MKEPKLHIVQLDAEVLYRGRYEDDRPHTFYDNVIDNRFEGYLVNTSATALYFEPKDKNGLIIVPHSWVKWCIPIDEDIKEGF